MTFNTNQLLIFKICKFNNSPLKKTIRIKEE